MIILLSTGTFVQQAVAQESTKAEKEREEEIQKAIDLQKKAMTEQNRVKDEQKKALDARVKKGEITEIQAVKELQDLDAAMMKVQVEAWSGDEVVVKGYPSRGGRSSGTRTMTFTGPEPFVSTYGGGDFYFGHSGGDSERTTWDFSKSVRENTFSKDYIFDVEKTVKNVVMSVMGDCKAGEIRIKIVMPNGKSYSEIVIDEFGNLNWRKSFNISDTENQDKTGDWKFQVSSTKATGFFKISLQTY